MGGVGEVAVGSLIAAAAGTATKTVMDRQEQKSTYKQMEIARKFNEQKRKNLLEERLARKRALIGSMGISVTGSSLASQNKMVSDTYKDINFDNYNYQTKHNQLYNNYYSNLSNQMINDISSSAQMIK